jgi:hypothetical protein
VFQKFSAGHPKFGVEREVRASPHPNRVLSQAVFQKFSAGHPKFGVEREVRASPWGLALTASRLDAPRNPKKTFLKKKNFTE